MLSRIAESLFWIGRYLERAEDTCRIVEVHLQLLLDDPSVDQEAAGQSLLEVMGHPSPEDAVVDPQYVLTALCYEANSPASVAARRRPARRFRPNRRGWTRRQAAGRPVRIPAGWQQ